MSTTIRKRPFAVRDVYLLLVHEPRPHPVPGFGEVNVVIVHALTLLRSDLHVRQGLLEGTGWLFTQG